MDAPETGRMGLRGGAKCEAEIALGYEAKAFMVAQTKNTAVLISKDYGNDRYGRLVVDLKINDQDLGWLGLKAGHLKAWPHRNGKALSSKPLWC